MFERIASILSCIAAVTGGLELCKNITKFGKCLDFFPMK